MTSKRSRVALERLYHISYGADYPIVWKLVAGSEANPEEIDDLVQSAYLRAWEALDQFKGDASFTTWVCSIAKHLIVDHIRSKHAIKRPTTLCESELPCTHTAEYDDEEFPSYYDRAATSVELMQMCTRQDHAADAQAEQGYAEALRQLKSPQRARVVQMRNEGYSNPEIALKLGISKSTVANIVSLAKFTLLRIL